MALTISQIGTLSENYVFAAFAPDGQTLYVWENNRGGDLRAYSYPGLVEGATILSNVTGPVACDDNNDIFWEHSTVTSQVWTDPGSPSPIFSLTALSSPMALCWSPYDDNLYLVAGPSSHAADIGLWRITKAGVGTKLPNGHALDSNGRNIVPTLDGGLWWQSTRDLLVRHDIPSDTIVTGAVRLNISDSWAPQPDHSVVGYGTHLGVRQGWRVALDAGVLTFTAEPAADVLALGQRGVAYVPDLTLVTVERHLSGEVWELASAVSRWFTGHMGWTA